MSDSMNYFNTLFEPDDIIEMRALKKVGDDNTIVKNIWCLSKDFTQHIDQCKKNNDDGFGIYIGGNPRNKEGGSKAADVSIARCVFADFDYVTVEEIRERLDKLGFLKPTLTFFSGHGVHCYWRLTVPMTDLTKWTAVQKRLIATVDSDTAIHDAPRIMRCPGFINTKPPIAETYIVEADPTRRYLLADIEENLVEIAPEPTPTTPLPRTRTTNSQGEKVRRAMAYVAAIPGSVEPGRNAAAQKVGAILTHDFDLSISEAECIHQDWNQKNKPPLSDAELSTCLTNGEKYGKKQKGLKLTEQPSNKKYTVNGTQKKRPLHKFPWTDSGAAEMLAEMYGDKIRYCYGWGKWLVYNGKYWDRKRGEAAARTFCKKAARALREEALKTDDLKRREAIEKYARVLEQSHKITATLKEAQHTAPFESYPDDYDSDNWAFNVQNGTIDLRTGKLQPHIHADLITYCAPVKHDENAKCPLWEKTLLEIFKDNGILVSYVQRCFGMCLTGDVREQILLVFYGNGRNGKNVLLDTYAGTMGDYACEAAPTLLTSRSGFDEHPTEIADLCGRRFVIACETQKGGKLKADIVKRLTGNARLKARFMKQDFFEFDRTFKIILCTNHRPEIPENTTAIWERLKVVPFNRVFTEAEQDKMLLNKLKKERPGILNWAVCGCLEWQKNGLQEPDEVEEATYEYQESQNPLDGFFDQCCKFDAFSVTPVGVLKKHFAEWEEETGRDLDVSTQTFNCELRKRGCKYETQYYGGQTQKVWCGIDLC